ncbi:hypothetical protein [Natronoglycomyces albus]|uniref:Uncharacterized protein n=1 Tax=Natronoglycomyces albus TaxID=2811108 RepID=A0A895XY85_9ACTN|nr:hypothetical protein [Natronoglycomyces albus]QSB07150.1 hypothetical protein JQS30_17050 [Natronoglycomyces albus]
MTGKRATREDLKKSEDFSRFYGDVELLKCRTTDIAAAASHQLDAIRNQKGSKERLEGLRALREETNRLESAVIAEARAEGLPWGDIAPLLGMNEKTVQRHHRDTLPKARMDLLRHPVRTPETYIKDLGLENSSRIEVEEALSWRSEALATWERTFAIEGDGNEDERQRLEAARHSHEQLLDEVAQVYNDEH